MIRQIAILILALSMPFAVLAAQPPGYQTSEGAIDGYDPVAYFISNAPTKGTPRLTPTNGTALIVISPAPRIETCLFMASPEKYAGRVGWG